jgi:Xaa-Pro dipeptidase
VLHEPFADRCRTTGAAAPSLGAAALLVADPATVRWLTGRQAEIEFGPPYPIWAGTFVVLAPDGTGSIICAEDDVDAGPQVDGLDVRAYEAYSLGPLRPLANAADGIRGALGDLGVSGSAPLAIDANAVPAGIPGLLGARPWVDAAPKLRGLRAVLDPAARERIRRTAAVVSAGQRAFREVAAPGMREIEVFSAVHAAMEGEAGVRVPVLPDLMSGERMLEVGRPPTDRVMRADELALCDLAARHDGYWADSCTTICLGRPTAEMFRLHDACRRALDAAIAAARPGTIAGDLDALARGVMADVGYAYPHHTGHAVGVTYHEEPRIVPGATAELEEGMVIALEPAGFGNGIGCRVEHLVEVTASGGRVLTDYDTSLAQR